MISISCDLFNQMVEVKQITGDITLVTDAILVHQCNCVTKYGKGLSESMFRRFPEAITYIRRREPSVPGTYDRIGNVVNLYGQYKPGGCSGSETAVRREQWFQQALNHLSAELATGGQVKVAFPYGIGCGLARGNWSHYYEMIVEFARSLPISSEVYIYRLP